MKKSSLIIEIFVISMVLIIFAVYNNYERFRLITGAFQASGNDNQKESPSKYKSSVISITQEEFSFEDIEKITKGKLAYEENQSGIYFHCKDNGKIIATHKYKTLEDLGTINMIECRDYYFILEDSEEGIILQGPFEK